MNRKISGIIALLLSFIMCVSTPISVMATEELEETTGEIAEVSQPVEEEAEIGAANDSEGALNDVSAANHAAYIEIEPIIEVNPYYADIIDPEDIVFEDSYDEPLVGSSEGPVATTVEEFCENYRNAFDEMVISHGYSCSADYDCTWATDYTEDEITALMRELMAHAKENQFIHSGAPTAGDYARWHYKGLSTGAYCEYGSTWTITVHTSISYYISEDMEAELTAKFESVMDSLDLDTKTEYGKIKAIYDYITSNVTYDYANLNNTEYLLKYTTYAALVNGTAVCQGYASLFYRMALAAGLDARIISGDGSSGSSVDTFNSNHGWNIVRLKGLYYNLDATWDSNEESPEDYDYFLKAHNSDDFPTHIRDEEFDTTEFHNEYPMATSNYVVVPSDLNAVTPKPVDVSTCTVTLALTSYTYNGSERKPSVTVKNGTTTLTSGTDYNVSYVNNVNAGTATVKITGKGNYSGTVSKTFTINKAAPTLIFESGNIKKTSLDESFTNALTKKTDGMVTFNSSDTEVATVDSESGAVTIKGVGTATITATAAAGTNYKDGEASYILTVTAIGIKNATFSGVSLSYGYSGNAYVPEVVVKVNGVSLTEGLDYTIKYENNINPGTAMITVTGIGNYTGTKIKTFSIIDCVSTLVSGRTYQLIPKNNSSTAVCSYSGRMVNNTKVYITDRTSSEAMRFKAIRNSDGTWKFINSKCELALAVQQNSSEVGKGLVLYDQTSKKAQNWKLLRKSDNSFAIVNAVSGLYVAMSDASAVKGTTLSMEENSGKGLQRFYIAEAEAVSTPFSGTKSVRASKNTKYSLNIASSSKVEGANVNLYTYSNTNAKKFKIMYSGGGYYRLVNVNSGLVLSVKGNTKADGANVIQSKWQAQSGQRWKITKNSDGTVALKNALGTVLHLSGNKTANGTNVVAKNVSTSGAQKWYLG